MHVLFDLDGTLTDPKPGITRSIAFALERMGRGPRDTESLAWCIGPPLRGSLGRLLKTEDSTVIERALGYYRERFSTIGLFENVVYPGVREMLEGLAAYDLHVATSKPTVFAKRIVDHFALSEYFRSVTGSELDGTRDAKADVIGHIVSNHCLSIESCVMVGDRRHDVEGAREHGIPCMGIGYGYAEPGELEEAGARPICATPAAVLAAVRELFEGGQAAPSDS